MATDKRLNLHELKDKPPIVVDKDSAAALLVSPKFINKKSSNRLRTGVPDANFDEDETSEEEEEGASGEGGIAAPEFSDIYIKFNDAYENIDSAKSYGKLIKNVSESGVVDLEFKIMIPLEIADEVVGIEILSKDEVIAEV